MRKGDIYIYLDIFGNSGKKKSVEPFYFGARDPKTLVVVLLSVASWQIRKGDVSVSDGSNR